MRRLVLSVGFLLALTASVRSWGQNPEGPFPKFRDGVTFPPLPAVVGAPFDVVKLFVPPPPDQNAAPLYLDALYEFGPELSSCFPQGPENDARNVVVRARRAQSLGVELALDKDPKSVPAAEIDAMLANYDEGFRKLADAQLREHCVFETGVGFPALLPHVQVARQVDRIATIRVRRELERGRIDDAVADVRTVVRFTRDLQRRGYLITELVVAVMMGVTADRMVQPILAAPGLTAAHCDALMAVFDEYEAKSIDAYAEALAMEYFSIRVTLDDMIQRQQKLAEGMGLEKGKSVVKALVDSQGVAGKAGPLPDDADEVIAQTNPEQLRRVLGELNGYFSALLDLKGKPRSEQLKKLPNPETYFQGRDLLTTSVRQIQPMVARLPSSLGRGEAAFRAAEKGIAVRRWQLAHGGASPDDLDAACKAAGLRVAPLDPFDGKPLRVRDDR